MRQRLYRCYVRCATWRSSWFVYPGDTSPRRLRPKKNRIQVRGPFAARALARALDMNCERVFEGVESIILIFGLAEEEVCGVQVVHEVDAQTYVISVPLSCVW